MQSEVHCPSTRAGGADWDSVGQAQQSGEAEVSPPEWGWSPYHWLGEGKSEYHSNRNGPNFARNNAYMSIIKFVTCESNTSTEVIRMATLQIGPVDSEC